MREIAHENISCDSKFKKYMVDGIIREITKDLVLIISVLFVSESWYLRNAAIKNMGVVIITDINTQRTIFVNGLAHLWRSNVKNKSRF
jgi:hypothetical protein